MKLLTLHPPNIPPDTNCGKSSWSNESNRCSVLNSSKRALVSSNESWRLKSLVCAWAGTISQRLKVTRGMIFFQFIFSLILLVRQYGCCLRRTHFLQRETNSYFYSVTSPCANLAASVNHYRVSVLIQIFCPIHQTGFSVIRLPESCISFFDQNGLKI